MRACPRCGYVREVKSKAAPLCLDCRQVVSPEERARVWAA